MINIVKIQLELCFPTNGVAPVDLRPPRNAGPHCVPAPLFDRIQWKVLEEQRPRSDQAHIAFDDVEQLRQFIERKPAQKGSDTRDAQVVGQQFPSRISSIRHGSKLYYFELSFLP